MRKIFITIIMTLFLTNNVASDFTMTKKVAFEFDEEMGMEPALIKLDNINYMVAYRGANNDGWVVIITVDTVTETISKKSPLEFDPDEGREPALEKIDSTHYLLAYRGPNDDGWAVIIRVDFDSGLLILETPFEFDIDQGREPALAKIDDINYLLVYRGPADDGWAVILEVDTGAGTISKKTPFEYDPDQGMDPALEKIDDTHFFVVYRGPGNDGWAVILEVDTALGTVTKGTPFEFDGVQGITPDISKINDTNYLVGYRGQGDDGFSVILKADVPTMSITRGTPLEFDLERGLNPAISKIDDANYFVTYTKINNDGVCTPLSVDINTRTITQGSSLEFDSTTALEPALENVDAANFLIAYRGPGDDGWITLLGIVQKIYLTSGTYISSVKDAGQTVHWDKLSWNESIPVNTDIAIQVRSGNINPPAGNFVGPDGTDLTYFTEPDGPSGDGNNINVTDNRFFQYKAYFTSSDSTITPKLYNATITFTLGTGGSGSKTHIYKWEESFK